MNQTDLHNDASTGDKVERSETVTGETSPKPSNTEEGSSEENTPVNETGLHDDPSTSEKVATNKTVADGTSDEQSNHEEGSSEENASQVPPDATSPYPKKSKTRHSVATAVDGTLLKCKHCGEEQEVIFDQTYFTVRVIVGELMTYIFSTVFAELCVL